MQHSRRIDLDGMEGDEPNAEDFVDGHLKQELVFVEG